MGPLSRSHPGGDPRHRRLRPRRRRRRGAGTGSGDHVEGLARPAPGHPDGWRRAVRGSPPRHALTAVGAAGPRAAPPEARPRARSGGQRETTDDHLPSPLRESAIGSQRPSRKLEVATRSPRRRRVSHPASPPLPRPVRPPARRGGLRSGRPDREHAVGRDAPSARRHRPSARVPPSPHRLSPTVDAACRPTEGGRSPRDRRAACRGETDHARADAGPRSPHRGRRVGPESEGAALGSRYSAAGPTRRRRSEATRPGQPRRR